MADQDLAYLAAALAVFWGGLALYLWRMQRMQTRIHAELERLRER